jgi:hypothetical protein
MSYREPELPARWLYGELTCHAGTREDFAHLAADWLTGVPAQLFPGLYRSLQASPPPDPRYMHELFVPAGPPGAVVGSLRVRSRPSRTGGSQAFYSERAWTRMLNGLPTAYPFDVRLTLNPLGGTGRPMAFGAAVGVHRVHAHPEWVRLDVTAHPAISAWPDYPGYDPRAVQDAWAEYFKAQAAPSGACFGHVTDDSELRYGTALERETRHDPDTTVARCHEMLRGYSWVTICAPEPAARLGGAAALTATGAFYEVSTFSGGQVFLRATPLIEDYEGAAVRRVFEALAPVLLAGRTAEPPPGYSPGLRVVPGVDAADYR